MAILRLAHLEPLLILCWLLAGSAPVLSAPPRPPRLSRDEQVILDLTNRARKEEKLSPLKPNSLLFEAALAHSKNMAAKGQMSHELDDKSPADRVNDAGYRFSYVGENIAYGTRLGPKMCVEMWMKSEHHRDNILRDKFTEIGIGIARNGDGDVYYTQIFATPR